MTKLTYEELERENDRYRKGLKEILRASQIEQTGMRYITKVAEESLSNKHSLPDGLRGIANYLPPLDDLPTQNSLHPKGWTGAIWEGTDDDPKTP